MPLVRLCTLAVGFEDVLVGVGRMAVQPGEESGSDVERDLLEVVDDVEDAVVLADAAGGRVGRVAFPCDPLVPVVIGRRRVLDFDRFKPRVLARRLVEMAVDGNEAVGVYRSFSHNRALPHWPAAGRPVSDRTVAT